MSECPDCGGGIKQGDEEFYCIKCGNVFDDSILDYEPNPPAEAGVKYKGSTPQKIRRQRQNIKEIDTLVSELDLDDQLKQEFRELFLIAYHNLYTKGRPFEITRWAILIAILQIRNFILSQKINTLLQDETGEFERIQNQMNEIGNTLDKLVYKDSSRYSKAIGTINGYFNDKMLKLLSKKYRELDPNTNLFIIRVPCFDNRAHYIENDIGVLFKEIKNGTFKFTAPEIKEQAKPSYFKSIKNKSLILAHRYLENVVVKEGKPKNRIGLVCACCYYITNRNFKDGYWLKPTSQKNWMDFFSITKNTFKERIRKLEKFVELNNIDDILY